MRLTVVLLTMAGLCTMAALVIGLDGDTAANALAWTAATAVVLAMAHPRRRVRQFWHLLLASVLGFGLFVVLHGLFDYGAGAAADLGTLNAILNGLSVASFLAAVYLCPPALVISLLGMVTMLIAGSRLGSGRETRCSDTAED